MATALPDLESSFAAIEMNDETIARAAAEEQNEIIALNHATEKWKLDVGAAFHRQWEEIETKLTAVVTEDFDRVSIDSDTLSMTDLISLLEDKVSVTSLLGDTGSGKSFVAGHLLSDLDPGSVAAEGPVTIDEIKKKGATTANINCYVHLSAKNKKTLILDYEGEKGARFPLHLCARRRLAHLTQSIEEAQHRRQAVTDYFPKLAYILSDVVILLGYDDFASVNYLTRCQEFALKANDGVSQMVRRPLLIIIQNKASLVQSVDSSAVTQKFFEIHGAEAEALRPFFSDIKCYCLPHINTLQRTDKGHILDGRDIFHRQIADLKQLLEHVRCENYQRSLTHAQWLYLLQRVLAIVQSGKSVSLHTLLSEILAHDDDQAIEIVIRCFLRLYNERSIHPPSWFADCYCFAMRVLAHCLAVKAHEQHELMEERIIREWCEKGLKQLSDKLDEFQPCVARYTGKGRSSKENGPEYAVHCYQHKGAHEGGHRTCQSVYGSTRWKRFWGLSSTDVWSGEFESSANTENHFETFSKDMVNDLSRMVRELMVNFRRDPENMYYLFLELFRGWFLDRRPIEIFCYACFCTSNSSASSSNSNSTTQNNSSSQQKRRRRRDLLLMQYRLLTRQLDSNACDSIKCQTCYQKLYNAWDASHHFNHRPIAPASSQADNDISGYARRSDSSARNSLLAPASYRRFSDSCTRNALLEPPEINENQ